MKERKLRKDAENRRQIILDKAASLFAEYGVENVSMRQIARESGVGQGTLYRSYMNKGDLCWDIIGESCIKNVQRMKEYLSSNADHPVRHRLEAVLSFHLESLEKHSSFLAIIENNTEAGQKTSSLYSEHYELVHSIIQRLYEEIAAEKSYDSLDPVFTSDAIMANMQPDVYLFLRHHRNYSLQEIQEKIFHVYVAPLFSV